MFNTAAGVLGGQITVSSGGPTRKPFTTNATGVATGLNADQVDGQSASDLLNPMAKVSDEGALDATVKRNATAAAKLNESGQYRVTFDRTVTGCAPTATSNSLDGGSVAATVSGSTTVDVQTRNPAGARAKYPFNLSLSC